MGRKHARYGNFTPTDNQEVIRARHLERLRRRLINKGFVLYKSWDLGKMGIPPHRMPHLITDLMNEGMLIHQERHKERNRWGELISYHKWVYTPPENDNEE